MRNYKLTFVFCSLVFFTCTKDKTSQSCQLTDISYTPTPFQLELPDGLPPVEHPQDNIPTNEGVELGRYLFYDPILSFDSTISCGSCHKIEKAFTDGLPKSIGINNLVGRRSSMSLINIAYSEIQSRDHNLMWDGKFKTLEQQILEGPVLDHVEMANTWENVEHRLQNHPNYPEMFRKAFGIDCKDEISRGLVTKAIAQFERSLISADSKFDRVQWQPFVYFTEQELRGLNLFMGDANGATADNDGDCAHCHSFSLNKTTFARNEFSNNGLDSVDQLNEFTDLGFGGVTAFPSNNGQFREVTLRNIALTAPYMHDGRFNTLDEVMDHYVEGLKSAPNIASELSTAPTLSNLTTDEKADIIAFLHTLTDSSYFQKTEWMSPF